MQSANWDICGLREAESISALWASIWTKVLNLTILSIFMMISNITQYASCQPPGLLSRSTTQLAHSAMQGY